MRWNIHRLFTISTMEWIIGATSMLIFGLLKSSFLKEIIAKLWDKLFSRFKKKTKKDEQILVTDNDILHHDIFSYIDLWVQNNIPALIFFTDFRTAVFRKYLLIFFTVYKEELQKYIIDGKYKTMTKPELKQSFLALLNAIINHYESEMILAGIPKLVVNKMKTRNNEILNLLLELIHSICDSNFYATENNYLKIYSFLNIISAVLESIIVNSEDVCNSINGELKGLTIDGTIEN